MHLGALGRIRNHVQARHVAQRLVGDRHCPVAVVGILVVLAVVYHGADVVVAGGPGRAVPQPARGARLDRVLEQDETGRRIGVGIGVDVHVGVGPVDVLGVPFDYVALVGHCAPGRRRCDRHRQVIARAAASRERQRRRADSDDPPHGSLHPPPGAIRAPSAFEQARVTDLQTEYTGGGGAVFPGNGRGRGCPRPPWD